MKGINTWSYHPYRPLLTEVGEIYICRIVPHTDKIHFEWLPISEKSYSVYYRKRYETKFVCWGSTPNTSCDIEGLMNETDYEFYVEANGNKSRTRLARCGESVGTVVNYLHPDDRAYAFSGQYLCSPSLVRHPDGYLLASMDLFAGGTPQNLTLIYRSDDGGETWSYVSELMPCFWGKLFLHRGELYMLACSTEYGDLLIGKSTDGGKSFSAPVCLLRGSGGKGGNIGVHKNPQSVFRHNGRIYETLEWGSWSNKEFCHAAMVMSCDENDDLLDPCNWSFTEPRKFAHFDPILADLPLCSQTIEGALTLSPDGRLLNVMRFSKQRHALVYEVNTEDHDAPLTYSHLMEFPSNLSKFVIKKDPVSGIYYSVVTRAYNANKSARNLLSLVRSEDLVTWETVCDLIDYRDRDAKYYGFQYVDFEFDGDDLIFLCRTAINGANSFHNANYSTFHRIKSFRSRPQS
ncbi:MAG: hypothetical protein IKJ35_05265 [Clostridia bacterium]|nr:hypothetical protein [Clostridia bacterium]